jgi:prepilin-type N-terminal cleavage/methylation domain-containing protein
MDDRTYTTAPHAQRGLTLIECLVVIAILAILMAIGPGSFSALLAANRLGSTQTELRALLAHARMEALARNSRVTVCRSHDGVQCAGTSRVGQQRWQGALQFVDQNQDRRVGAGESVAYAVRFHPAVSAVWNRGDSLVYQADGTARGGSNGTFVLQSSSSEVEHRLVVSLLGRVRTEVVAP